MDDPLIYREEVIALLFNVSTIVTTLNGSKVCWSTEMAKRETKAEAEARRADARASAEWLRELAERAEAKLPPEKRRPHGRTNAEWLRELAEKGKAELDERKAREA